MSINLSDRIHGALLGAAMGAELGYARAMHGERVAREAGDFAKLIPQLTPHTQPVANEHRLHTCCMRPFIEVGVRAYITRGGRVTPEHLGNLIKDDAGLATPAFGIDNIHTIQEILKEGMHPRLSGLGNAPNGLISAAMPAVGIYHFADPEYAYIDGVELGSVAQGRTGADWAGLCAAGIAAAFDQGASGQSVVDAVIGLAFKNNKEVYYQLNRPVNQSRWYKGKTRDFINWWMQEGGHVPNQPGVDFISWNPMRFVLPLLHDYADKPEMLMSLLVAAPGAASPNYPWMGMHTVPAIIAGAISGAMHGPAVFPDRWRAWAEPVAQPWLAIGEVVGRRMATEKIVIECLESRQRPHLADGLSPLEDKLRGCLLAGAIGNAMGSPVEGMLYAEVDAKHPGGIKTILEPWRLESEDDNQLAALLVETYIRRDGLPVTARHFGAAWKEFFNRDHFFVQCMGHVYDLIMAGWDPRITGHWTQVTGSTVMCMEPVGLYHAADPEFAAIDATAISYMYQRGLDVMAATMLAATVSEALRPEATVDSICQAALAAAPTGPFKTFDRRGFESPRHYIQVCLDVADKYTDVMAARAELYGKCLFYSHMDPMELWGLALAMFKIAQGDVRQAAIGGTNIGRDSDTIAGRGAMLAGTLQGAAGVPPEWVAMFSRPSLERINTNAARLAELILTKKLPRMRRRQVAGQ